MDDTVLSKQDSQLISMGFNIGLYSAAQMIIEGLPTDPNHVEALKRVAAADLHKITGMPIEDFASMIDPMMKGVADQINEGGIK